MKIAGVQMDVLLGDVSGNLERMASRFHEAAQAGAGLVVFPECAVTRYCFSDLEEARPFAESIPGPATEFLSGICDELNAFALFGMLEADGDPIYNATVLHLLGLDNRRLEVPGRRRLEIDHGQVMKDILS